MSDPIRAWHCIDAAEEGKAETQITVSDSSDVWSEVAAQLSTRGMIISAVPGGYARNEHPAYIVRWGVK